MIISDRCTGKAKGIVIYALCVKMSKKSNKVSEKTKDENENSFIIIIIFFLGYIYLSNLGVFKIKYFLM